MANFFPAGFWPAVAVTGTIIFLVFGADLMFGAKLIRFLSTFANRKYQVDQVIVNALHEIKKVSDREYDVEHSMTKGWGRFVMGGILFFSAALVLTQLLPRLK